jgi:hypothetical protein
MGLNIILKGGRIGCIPPKPKGKGFLQPIRWISMFLSLFEKNKYKLI